MTFQTVAPIHTPTAPRARLLALIAAAIAIGVLANAMVAAYVTSERTVYYWDWSRYWIKFETLGQLFSTDPVAAITAMAGSIKYDDYNVLPIVPLIPVEVIFGSSRLSYILGITNVAILPAAVLMAWIAERTWTRRSWPRFLFCTALLLGFHVLWAPALRGLPDAFGLVIACLVLLSYFSTAREYRLLRLVGLGTLLCILGLTRRWYLFWVIGFFAAAPIAHLIASSGDGIQWERLRTKLGELVIVGGICAAYLLLVAAPLVVREATTDYSSAYAAYRPELAGGLASQVPRHFGYALLGLSGVGLGTLVIRKNSRELGVLLIVQAIIVLALFLHIQGLLGVQHYYLLVPATAIGLAALVAALWNAAWHPVWRATGVAAIAAIILLSSLAVFDPEQRVANPLLPQVRYAPLVRPDLAEMNRLFSTLAKLRPKLVYVAASSEVLNWSTLKVGCRTGYPDICPHIAVSADIDTRDGFPKDLLTADYAIVATPNQYHVRPEDQQVVGLVANHIREGTAIGSSFRPLPLEFNLMNGVRVQIYRRTMPLRNSDVQALSEELTRSYPQLKSIFEAPG